MVVGAHRRRPVAHVGEQPHQHAIAGLLKRLQLDAAPRDGHRPGEIAGPRPGGADQVAQLHALPFEPCARLGGPVVIHAGQQVAAVLRERLGAMPDHRVVVAGLGRGPSAARRSVSKARTSAWQVGPSTQHKSLAVTRSEPSSPSTWRR